MKQLHRKLYTSSGDKHYELSAFLNKFDVRYANHVLLITFESVSWLAYEKMRKLTTYFNAVCFLFLIKPRCPMQEQKYSTWFFTDCHVTATIWPVPLHRLTTSPIILPAASGLEAVDQKWRNQTQRPIEYPHCALVPLELLFQVANRGSNTSFQTHRTELQENRTNERNAIYKMIAKDTSIF